MLLASMIGVIILSKKSAQPEDCIGVYLSSQMSTITPEHFLILSFLLIGIGFLGLIDSEECFIDAYVTRINAQRY